MNPTPLLLIKIRRDETPALSGNNHPTFPSQEEEPRRVKVSGASWGQRTIGYVATGISLEPILPRREANIAYYSDYTSDLFIYHSGVMSLRKLRPWQREFSIHL